MKVILATDGSQQSEAAVDETVLIISFPEGRRQTLRSFSGRSAVHNRVKVVGKCDVPFYT